MGKRKRIGAEKIDLSYYEVRQAEYVDEYDLDEDTLEGFSLEELEELGVISYPKTAKIIQDGEQAFFSAIKNGEDW